MGAPNFCYDNRCVVVTDEDYEVGHHPLIGDYRHESLHSYPSRKLDGYDFHFWDVVLTSGYYSGGCIDYVERQSNGRDIWDYFSPYRYESVAEFVGEAYSWFGGLMSKSRIRKIFSGFKASGNTLSDFIEDRYEEFVTIAENIERERVDAAINKIKEEYGYQEYAVSARFSNGETWYRAVS
ncbi:hypothetical protein [Alistipes indistinctus]|uniref:hypothetical protein n=1 Tax=Alistipes indistinctus TaxID=626932 RepID=UPI00205A6005|nr:MAG TPA: hypothetical protein [Caudoviricetes sp.]